MNCKVHASYALERALDTDMLGAFHRCLELTMQRYADYARHSSDLTPSHTQMPGAFTTWLSMQPSLIRPNSIQDSLGWNEPVVMGTLVDESWYDGCQVSILLTGAVYPYIPSGYRRLPLDMDEMETDGEDEGSVKLELELDQLERS